jgi:Glyoxalase/Bleomycin resistance protein/Dioxygenase superfamily
VSYYPTIVPYLAVSDAAAAIDFYKRAFGAEEKMRVPGENRGIMHAEVLINGGLIMLTDSAPEQGFPAPNAGELVPSGLWCAGRRRKRWMPSLLGRSRREEAPRSILATSPGVPASPPSPTPSANAGGFTPNCPAAEAGRRERRWPVSAHAKSPGRSRAKRSRCQRAREGRRSPTQYYF